MRLVLREGAGLTGRGLACGVAAALFLARPLSAVLYGTSTSDPVILTAALALLGAIAVAACFMPARRAARLDPARVLAETAS
jgi:ABC-type antimicrobial peptide transport system permease subunit